MKAKDKPVEYFDTEETGLILRLSVAGTKTFAYRYQIGEKKKRRITLGTFPGLGLSDARKKVQKLKVQINDGLDPQAEKEEKKHQRAIEPKTIKQVIDTYIEKHLPTLKPTTQKDYKYRVKHFIKGEGSKKTKQRGFASSRPVKSIKRYEVLEYFDDVAKTSPVQAQRLQAILSGIFKFAKDRGWVDVNVANEIRIKNKRTKEEGKWQNVEFDDDQIKKLWNAFDEHPDPVSSLFKMLMLLGQRSGETRKMKWDDIDFENKIWAIPASDTKNKEEHYVPLPDTAMAILNKLRSGNQNKYVFASPVKENEPVGSAQKTAERLKKTYGVTDFNIHSMRTTVATRLAGLGTPPQVLSKILNHKRPGEGSFITQIYNKYDYEKEKREALNKWNGELNRIVNEKDKQKEKSPPAKSNTGYSNVSFSYSMTT
ncbi:tyrosine-type recombinase/integrase [Gracilimonas sp. BCB1]